VRQPGALRGLVYFCHELLVEALGGRSPGHNSILACKWTRSLASLGSAVLASARRMGGGVHSRSRVHGRFGTPGRSRPLLRPSAWLVVKRLRWSKRNVVPTRTTPRPHLPRIRSQT